MGSMIMTETIDEDKLQGIFDAFAELPYKVVWKATKEKFSSNLRFPSNIHFEPWLPQLDVLCRYYVVQITRSKTVICRKAHVLINLINLSVNSGEKSW